MLLIDIRVGKYNCIQTARFQLEAGCSFKECDDKFLQFLALIEAQLAPPNPIGLSDPTTSLPEGLFQYSFGRPGYLVQLLQEAYRILGVYDPDFNDFSQID